MAEAEQLHLMVNQSVAKLRDLYEASQRNLKQMQDNAEYWKKLAEQRRSSGSSSRTVELETRVAELETTERRLREYMRLKDIAKMKVERDRDLYLRQRNRAEDRITALHDKAAENAELKSMNTRQAEAFKDKEKQCVDQQRKIRELQGRLDNVMQIMQNAVDGVRSDNRYGEWRPWPEAVRQTTWRDGRDFQGG